MTVKDLKTALDNLTDDTIVCIDAIDSPDAHYLALYDIAGQNFVYITDKKDYDVLDDYVGVTRKGGIIA